MGRRATAEFIGTFWLVFAGCGTAVMAGAAAGPVGISLAFGLALLTMGYVVGPISGCHLNPAVTLAMAVAKRFAWKDVAGYFVAQVTGAIAGAGALQRIARGRPGFDLGAGFGSNGYGQHSPGLYSVRSSLTAETLLTFFFVLIVLMATRRRASRTLAPVVCGLSLSLVHLVLLPVTNASVNPARSTGPAVFVGDWALGQLWLFWLAPLAGAAAAGFYFTAWMREEAPDGRD